MEEIWQKLAEPFSPSEVQWRVETLSKDKTRALVVPYVDARSVLDRLDQVVGPENWSDQYEVLYLREGEGEKARLCEVKCRLTVFGVTKEDVGEGDSLKAAFSDALKWAAVKFGIGRYLYRIEGRWVDYDPKTGRFTPPHEEEEEKDKPEPQRLIDRLVERLKEEGLGKEAAQVLIRYKGYGSTPEETKKLYGELRKLLKKEGHEGPGPG
ncbi:MAG: Rad52/Rad22 family DNA repair protein [Thermaceae bacterium]